MPGCVAMLRRLMAALPVAVVKPLVVTAVGFCQCSIPDTSCQMPPPIEPIERYTAAGLV